MTDNSEQTATQGTTPELPLGVGLQLRAAREKMGLTLDQVSAQTRISLRHLELIEASDFEELPGRTYAVGFAKSYAKVVGLDQTDVADMVRAEMQLEPIAAPPPGSFEPGDPSRAPSGRLVWFSVFAVILLLVGLFFAARVMFSPAAEMGSLIAQEEAEEAERLAAQEAERGEGEAAVAPSGPVVFTAGEEPVWVRFYDAQGRVLMEGEMAAGESYTVPADVENPMLITGRPDLLNITIGGRDMPRIDDEPVTVTDEPVSAAALLARGQPASAAPAADTVSAPAARATSSPTARAAPSPAARRTSTPPVRRTAPPPRAAASAPAPAATPEPEPAASPPEPISSPVVQAIPGEGDSGNNAGE